MTRRPLVLQLVTLTSGEADYAEFLYLPNEKFYVFSQLCKEIEKETDRHRGTEQRHLSPSHTFENLFQEGAPSHTN